MVTLEQLPRGLFAYTAAAEGAWRTGRVGLEGVTWIETDTPVTAYLGGTSRAEWWMSGLRDGQFAWLFRVDGAVVRRIYPAPFNPEGRRYALLEMGERVVVQIVVQGNACTLAVYDQSKSAPVPLRRVELLDPPHQCGPLVMQDANTLWSASSSGEVFVVDVRGLRAGDSVIEIPPSEGVYGTPAVPPLDSIAQRVPGGPVYVAGTSLTRHEPGSSGPVWSVKLRASSLRIYRFPGSAGRAQDSGSGSSSAARIALARLSTSSSLSAPV